MSAPKVSRPTFQAADAPAPGAVGARDEIDQSAVRLLLGQLMQVEPRLGANLAPAQPGRGARIEIRRRARAVMVLAA